MLASCSAILLLLTGLAQAFFNPEAAYTIPQLITYYGYSYEAYNVTTSDGYILGLYRVPTGLYSSYTGGPRPVMLMIHGLGEDGSEFLLNPGNASSALYFADSGMDVFIANYRGTPYGLAHTHLSANVYNAAFWDFTMDEFIKFDVTAIVDAVLNISGSPSIYITGHSQGGLSTLSMLSANVSYNAKVRGVFGWAAVSNTKFSTGLAAFVQSGGILSIAACQAYALALGFMVPPVNPALYAVAAAFFCNGGLQSAACQGALGTIVGQSLVVPQNSNRNDVLFGHTPSTTSIKNLEHWIELPRCPGIANCKFDYGFFGNLAKYGTFIPPSYDYSHVATKVWLYSGGQDALSTAGEAAALQARLTGAGVFQGITNIATYNHLDFLFAVDAVTQVYAPVVATVYADFNGSG